MKKHLHTNLRLLTIAFFLLVGVQYAFSQARLFAVIVGVSEHQNPSHNLTFAHTDAINMYDFLRLYTTPERIQLLTDEDATYYNVVKHMSRLFSQARPEDVVIFFFAGHGHHDVFQMHDKEKQFSTLQRIFRESNANRRMIFADTCHAGSLRQPGNRRQANPGANVMLFLSSRNYQLSWESSALQGGFFTQTLMSGLRGGADANNDGNVTAIELFKYVNPRVRELSGDTQVPVMWGRFDRDMVILRTRR